MSFYFELKKGSRTLFHKITPINNKFIDIEEGYAGVEGYVSRYLVSRLIEDRIDKYLEEYQAQGYTECTEPPSPIPAEYQRLIDSKDLVSDLKHYFEYLVDSEEARPAFNEIMETAIEAKFEEGLLIIQFDTAVLTAWPPADPDDYQHWPASFRKIVSRHSRLEFPQSGYALVIGDVEDYQHFHHMSPYLETLTAAEFDQIQQFKDEASVMCPFVDYRNFMFYHPSQFNSHNEPALFAADPNTYKSEPPIDLRLGSIFLLKAAAVI